MSVVTTFGMDRAYDRGRVDEGYPQFDWGECDEAEVGFTGLVVAGGDAAPVLELAEQTRDQIAPAMFLAVMWDRYPAVALGRDDRLDAGSGDLGTDGIGVVTFVGKQRLDAVGHHPEQRAKALDIMRLAGRQHEPERPAVTVASGVEFGGEATARSAKPLVLLIPLFSPTAQ